MSRTPLRTTPVRAIPSTLATRSSPSIPPPSQLYDPVLRAVLRHRLIYNIFLHSVLLSWVHAVAWSVWQKGGLSSLGITGSLVSPILPLTLASALLTWIFVALPVIVLRKVYLTSSRTCATSPSGSLKAALAKPSTFRSFTTYFTSSIAALALHVSMAYIIETDARGDPRLSIFVKSKKHPHYLNGQLLYLIISQLCVALGFSLRNIMLDRFVFNFSLASLSPPRKHPYNLLSTFSSLTISILCTTLTSLPSALLFGLIRMLLLPFVYKLPLLPYLLRPFTAHFLHPRSGYTLFLPFHHFSLLCRGWFLGFATTFIWESASVLFDAYITQPISTIPSSSPPSQPAILSLVSGVSSADGTFRYLAYTELLALASSTSNSGASHRGQLFNDQKHNPHLWTHLVRESLLILGRDYQLLLRRGIPPPAPAPQAPATKPKPSLPVEIAKPIGLIKKPTIFQSGAGKQSPLRKVVEGLGSDGVLAQALDEGAEKVNVNVGTVIPELFRSIMRPPEKEKAEAKGAVENKGKTAASILRLPSTLDGVVHATYEKWVPPQARELVVSLRKWWTQERPRRRVEACLPNRELDVVVVDVLSHLTAASLTEDTYGIVQRDIPRILEALLSFLQAVEDYRAEVRGMYVEQEPAPEVGEKEREERERMRVEVERAGEVLGYVEDGLKEGVARLVRTFGDKLLAFKFPPKTARKLQGFLEYC